MLLTLAGVPKSDIWLRDEQEIAGSAIVTRLENKLTGLDRLRDDTAHSIERLHGEVTRAGGLSGKPFPQADLLAAVRARVSAIAARLEDMAERAGRDQAGLSVPAMATEAGSSVDLEAER